MKCPAPVLLLLLGLAGTRAAEPSAPIDLGEELGYVRIHSSAEAEKVLGPVLRRDAALIVDLRYPTDGLAHYEMVGQLLEQHPTGKLLFLLVSPDTPPRAVLLVQALAARSLVLGATGSWVPAQHGVLVAQTAAADRQAYDAFETGQPAAALIAGKIEKDRYDEAALMTDFHGGNPDPLPPAAPDTAKAKPAADGAAKPVPTDRVWQRAVHLHRALLAIPRQG